MRILMEVTQKMKLYNVYRLCKQNIDIIENVTITESEETRFDINKKIKMVTINNWKEQKDAFNILLQVPILTNPVNEYIKSVPDIIRNEPSPRMSYEAYMVFKQKQNLLYNKMQTIIELYESMNIESDGYGVDIKMPPCESLSEYISYLKDIDFIFNQCPFLQYDGEIVKFGAVDVGSNWLKLTLATTSTFFVLSGISALIDSALVLRSHYITLQQQEEMLRSQQIKNDLAEQQIELFTTLKTIYINEEISKLESNYGKPCDPEERDKVEMSLDKLILFLDKGGEIYATLDSPEDVQALFPQMQTNYELPSDIIKYLEEKDTSSREH